MKKLLVSILLTNSLLYSYSYKYTYGDSVSYLKYKNNSGWKGVVVDRRDGRYKVEIISVEVNGFLATGLQPSECSGNIFLSYSDRGKKIWVPEYCLGNKSEEEDESSGWETAGKILLGVATLAALSSSMSSNSHTKKSSRNKKIKWIYPSDSLCIKNGGKLGKDGICKANWDNAKSICRSIGGRLPTIGELKAIITDCGGITYNSNHNENSSSYQSCYKRKGFSSDGYWSSTTVADLEGSTWGVDFSYGGVGYYGKSYGNYVQCVRDE